MVCKCTYATVELQRSNVVEVHWVHVQVAVLFIMAER
jgi:hypothetical protein